MDPRVLLEENLALVDRIAGVVCRRHAVYGDDADEFGSWAKMRLIDNDYAILRKFEGRSSLRTYLNVVINNLFRDHRIARWGKWRPSAAARRLGPTAVLLETLVARDGHEVEAAVRMLRENARVDEDAETLRAIARELPRRTQRRVDASDTLDELAATPAATDSLDDAERAELATRAAETLRTALASLDPEDRLLLKLRFDEGWTIATIARSLGRQQKPLYRHMERLLRSLRDDLENADVDRERAAELLGWPRLDLTVDYGADAARTPVPRPSTEETATLGGGGS